MPRKGEVPKRKPLPDPKFTDQPVDMRRRVTKFVNTVMQSGKKAIAERIVYGAFDIIAEKAKDDPVKVWDRALDNVKPKVEVKSRRVGGATYQVPVDVRPDRAHGARHALAGRVRRATAPRRRCRRSWRASSSTLRPTGQRGQEARRHAQDGRRQQGVRPLPLVAHRSAGFRLVKTRLVRRVSRINGQRRTVTVPIPPGSTPAGSAKSADLSVGEACSGQSMPLADRSSKP